VLIPALFILIYPVCLLWAAVSDARTMTIPNKLTLALTAAFVPAALLLHMSWQDLGVHLGFAAVGLVLGITLFAFGLMGGGDAKLIAAASLWLGLHGFLALLVYTALAGGALTLGLMGARKVFSPYRPALPAWVSRHLEPKGDIPYGIAICAGGLVALMQSDLLVLLKA